MKQKDTLITAIKKCRNLWLWIANHPDKVKSDYFKSKKVKRVLNDCFSCDYAFGISRETKTMCKHCFLLNTWKQFNEIFKSFYIYPCETLTNSPYAKWKFINNLINENPLINNRSLLEQKSRLANEIVEGCDLELKKLQGN